MSKRKTQKVVNQLKRQSQRVQPQTPIGGNFFIPNHSGDHSAGRVLTTPSTDYEIANKKYVDDNIGGGGSPEGTDVKSTGETGATKYLREDGDGTSSWQNIAATDLPVGSAGEQLTVNEAETALEFSLASKYIQARNVSGSTITKGSPVYISGWNAGQSAIEISDADADSAATMPAVGLAFEDIANNSNGRVIMSGNTVGIVDTSAWSVGDAVYVSGTAGTLTNTKPTSGEIQKIGTVGRSHATLGQLTVVGAGRTNDIPNSSSVNMILTADNNTNDTQYTPQVLHGTDATPPTASTVPRGTIYIQYTA